jgi:hypothetical protein
LHCADEADQRSDPETGAELNIPMMAHAATDPAALPEFCRKGSGL